MGTRNLTMVIDQEGETKVAQYGQWDGYPDGVGISLLEFLRNAELFEKLKSKLKDVRFLDSKGKDKEFSESYDKNAPEWSNQADNRTPEQIKWFKNYCHRDLAEGVLKNIAESDDEEIILIDKSEFGKDSVFCEWCYVVDLKKNQLIVYNDLNSEPLKSFDLSNLPTEDEFLNEFKDDEEE